MLGRVVTLIAVVFAAAAIMGCNKTRAAEAGPIIPSPVTRFDPKLAAEFFPLQINSEWTYNVDSKSQRADYVITDRVVGEKYVPALNVTGELVEELYSINRGGVRPILYTADHGYFNRLSGLNYDSEHEIEVPAWGRTQEGQFLPIRLKPDIAWTNQMYPFGKMPGAFYLNQRHRSYFETNEVIVPAGKFDGCIRIETQTDYVGGGHPKGTAKLTYFDWYAPHVGLVKSLALEGGLHGTLVERVELVKYKVSRSDLGGLPWDDKQASR